MEKGAMTCQRDRIGSTHATAEDPERGKAQELASGSAIGARKANAEEPFGANAEELDAAAARTSRTEQGHGHR